MRILPEPIIFEWDKGNSDKNIKKHNVANRESESIFINMPHFIIKDERHSLTERRYLIWGATENRRKLSVFFTIRKEKIRIISARDMHIKERREYEKRVQEITKV